MKEFRVHCDDILVFAEDAKDATLKAAKEFTLYSWAEETGQTDDTDFDYS